MPKLKSRKLTKLSEILKRIESYQSANDTVWFRGVGTSDYPLTPSIARINGKTADEIIEVIEPGIPAMVGQRSLPFVDVDLSGSWRRLFFMQHYGVPTRLLDWTESPFVALYFALTSVKRDDNGAPLTDVAVWLCNPTTWNRHALAHISFDGGVLDESCEEIKAYAPGEKLTLRYHRRQQRLETVFEFFDNKVTLDKHFVWRMDPSLQLGGLSLRDLQNRYATVAEEFENANLTIMSVFTEDETLINDLFVRLNRSKSLTGAEVRNAFSGPVVKVIRNLSKHVLFEENIKFSTLRAGDQNAAAKVLLFEYGGELTSTKKIDLDSLAKEKVEQQRLELAARRVVDVFDEMRDVFIPNDPLLASAGVFPVYYWLIREVYTLYQDDLRPFLLWFEKQRKENRGLEREKGVGQGLNPTYSHYDTLNRSTNDGSSHVGRHKILREQFYKYLTDRYEISGGETDVFAELQTHST